MYFLEKHLPFLSLLFWVAFPRPYFMLCILTIFPFLCLYFILSCYSSVSSASEEACPWLRGGVAEKEVCSHSQPSLRVSCCVVQQLGRFWAHLLLLRWGRERQRDICRQASCGQNCEVESLPFVPEPSFLKLFLCLQLRFPFYFFSGSRALLSLLVPALRGTKNPIISSI